MSNRLQSWTLALVVLVVACLINSLIIQEIVQLLDENISIAKVSLAYHPGWQVAMAASGFSLIGTFLNWIVSLSLMIMTNQDHINITNAEADWKHELDRRNMVYDNGVLQGKNHLKYKKSRISPWTWVLPILLTMISCGFGTMANFHPKLNITKEAKGNFGRSIEKIFREIEDYEKDLLKFENDTNDECFPFLTFADILNDHHNQNKNLRNFLVRPIDQFRLKANEIIEPMKKSISNLRKELILHIDEEIFGGNMQTWTENYLPLLALIFTIPRFLCLLVLLFGCFMASIFQCTMQISPMCEAVQPRKIVDCYGKIAMFSMVYVIGAQLSISNILSSFGVPFFHIFVQYGTGFFYDLVADAILFATYVGMNNEYFFAIPRKQVLVTFSIEGTEGTRAPGGSGPGAIPVQNRLG